MRDTHCLFVGAGTKWAMLVLPLLSLQVTVEAQDDQYLESDISYGVQLYRENCTRCHGSDGDQVDGVNFRDGQFRRASTDAELSEILLTGIPGTAMPSGAFTPPELVGLVAYLRTMGDVDAQSVARGDADRGRRLSNGKGECSGCHRVNGVGPRSAPDLSRIGAVRTAGTLAQVLLDPNGAMRSVDRPVRLVLSDGKLLQGRRLNEDSFSIQIVTTDETLVSIDKANLREYTVLRTALMPSATSTLNSDELDDVVAYLLTLKGL